MAIFGPIVRMASSMMKEKLSDIIRLEAIEDETTMTLKDGSLVTLIEIRGSLVTLGLEGMEDVVERIRISIAPYLTHPGHALEFSFMRDPMAATEEIHRKVEKTRQASARLGLDLDDVLNERKLNLSRFMTTERFLLAVYTRPSVMTADEAKESGKEISGKLMAFPAMQNAQIPGKVASEVHSRHASLCEGVVRDLSVNNLIARDLPVAEALQEIKASLYPETSPYKNQWHPRIPRPFRQPPDGTPMNSVNLPDEEAEAAGFDYSNLGVPSFDLQLTDKDARTLDSRTVRIGDTLFSSFDLTLSPEVLTPFNELVAAINHAPFPVSWRVNFLIEAGGLQSLMWKEQYVRAFLFTSPTRNRRIRDAIDELREIDGRIDTAVRMRVTFTAWAPTGEEELLRRSASLLKRSVERWGVCEADGLVGDMMETTVSTVPGVAPASTAPSVVAPLAHSLSMLPFDRQASPWDDGPMLFRTEDGKPWPFAPGSSLQTTFNTLLVGTPGSGKSVTLNALNLGSALAATPSSEGEPEMPMIGIIDIGFSSSGLISMIKEALPAKRRHEVVFRRLKMTIEQAINPFDTQLGMRFPLPSERVFLTNFMAVVCQSGDKDPSGAMMGLINASIDQAYEMYSDEKQPKRYIEGDEGEVDEALVEVNFEPSEFTSWWDIVDLLMDHGRIHEAELAQKHAVPVLADLVTASRVNQIEIRYGGTHEETTGEDVISAFKRIISEVTQNYPILAGHTRFDIGSARIAALDLNEVTARGSGASAARQSAIMFMLARNILARNYFLDEEDIHTAVSRGHMPDIFKDYHLKRARVSRETPKTICIDEYHRTGGIQGISAQTELDMREGRKFNVRLSLASQRLEDFNAAIQDLATGVFICNSASPGATRELVDAFDINPQGENVLRYELSGPSRHGAPFYLVMKTKQGTIQQKLILTLGPIELWAFNTTAEDVALRNNLYDSLGPKKAREVLAVRFPGGTAKSEIEARISRLEEAAGKSGEQARGNVIGDLAEDLRKQAMLMGAPG